MSSSTLLLQRANLIIRDELFPILGIPPEIYGNRPNDIINNLMEIRAELRRMAIQSQQQNNDLQNNINKLRNAQKSQQESELLSDISQLFE